MVPNQQPSNSRFNRKKESLISRLLVRIKQSSKKQRIIFLVVFFIFVMFLFLIIYSYGAYISYIRSNDLKKSVNCSSNRELIESTTKAQLDNDRTKLSNIYQKVIDTPGYENDQNCQYIITLYFVSKGDDVRARQAFTAYSKVYNDASTRVNGADRTYVWGKDNLESKVKFVESFAKQLHDNGNKLNHPNNSLKIEEIN